jgi:hypothetical protein
VSNVDSDAEVRTKAQNHVLREICKKYKESKSPIFTREEVQKRLEGYFPDYLNANIRKLFQGSGLVEIDDNYNLALNEKGKQSCKRGELVDSVSCGLDILFVSRLI